MTTATKKLKTCRFSWDEPEGCTTPRGWVHLKNHPDKPDRYSESDCVGNYCTYNFENGSRGPNGETVHACAYIFRYTWDRRQGNIGLGFAWFHTVEEAKAFIEGNIRAYFGLAREAAS